MGYSIKMAGAIISMVYNEFNCPKCTCKHTEDDYYDRLYNSKKGFIYKKCKGCKTTIGITSDYKSDVRVWLKEDEQIIHGKIRKQS